MRIVGSSANTLTDGIPPYTLSSPHSLLLRTVEGGGNPAHRPHVRSAIGRTTTGMVSMSSEVLLARPRPPRPPSRGTRPGRTGLRADLRRPRRTVVHLAGTT